MRTFDENELFAMAGAMGDRPREAAFPGSVMHDTILRLIKRGLITLRPSEKYDAETCATALGRLLYQALKEHS